MENQLTIMDKSEMQEAELSRGRVITSFAYLESQIHLFLTEHYAPKDKFAFVTEVLENPNFSTFLLFSIFKSIVKNYYPEIEISGTKLDQYIKLRNIIAHGITAIRIRREKEIIRDIVICHGGSGSRLLSDLMKEFKELHSYLKPVIATLPGTDAVISNTVDRIHPK